MIITISGMAGSGKSTAAKNLMTQLHAERIYVGGIRRELAREKGMTLTELNEYAKTHPETDVDIDKNAAAQALELERQGKIVIAEGRTQFYFLPLSIKIFITVEPQEGAHRVWSDLQQTGNERNEGQISSLKELEKELTKRNQDDAARYQKYYGFDHRDLSQYDLVIDSTKTTSQEVVSQILRYLKTKKLIKTLAD